MRTIRRSGARDLPPDADSVKSAVTVLPKGDPMPAVGDIVTVAAYCGLQLEVRIDAVEPDETGWRAWATEMQNRDDELRALGVYVPKERSRMRVFDFQVQNR